MKLGRPFFLLVSLHPVLVLADPVPVRHPQGSLHGFLTIRAQDGAILASGDLSQSIKGDQLTNQLIFRFRDGSVHQETTIFSQKRHFRLISYRLVQKGATFKRPTELQLNASTGQVNIKYTDDDGEQKSISERLDLPADTANGLVATLLNNIDPRAAKTTVSMVVSTPKPRLIKLEISPDGDDSFLIAGTPRKASRYVARVEIGGISGVIAPVIGKQPPDTHFWVVGGKVPGFLKSEGPLCDGCPIWRIELASPVWSSAGAAQTRK